MKEKLLIGFAALALGLVAAFNINLNTQKSELSAFSLANVEALASESQNYRCNSPYTEHCATEGSINIPGVKAAY